MSLAALEQMLAERFGLVRDGRLSSRIQRRVKHCAAARQISVESFAEHALADPSVLSEASSGVTVGETYFLRHHQQLELLVRRLGEILMATSGRVGVWSAGCATGEEPYSVGILAERLLGSLLAERLDILGTDLDSEALAQAERAVYTPWSFRRAPGWLVPGFFERLADGSQRLNQRLRERVRFEPGNVLDAPGRWPAASFHAVVFRNVAIYMTDDAVRRFHAAAARVLAVDGVLVQSPADPAPPKRLFVPVPDAIGIYRPAAGATAAEQPRAWAWRPPAAPPDPAPPIVLPPPPRSRAVVPAPPPPRRPPPRPSRVAAPAPKAVEAPPAPKAVETDVDADAAAWLERGREHLAKGDFEVAARELRGAVFLAPDEPMARLWYAVALRDGGRVAHARRQLEILEGVLDQADPTTTLSDGSGTVAELRELVSHLLEVTT